jgi:hypothetical protein
MLRHRFNATPCASAAVPVLRSATTLQIRPFQNRGGPDEQAYRFRMLGANDRAGFDHAGSVRCRMSHRSLQQVMAQSLTAFALGDEKTGDRPKPGILRVIALQRTRHGPVCVPARHVGARGDLNPANRLAVLKPDQPGRQRRAQSPASAELPSRPCRGPRAVSAQAGNSCTSSRNRPPGGRTAP